MISNRKLRGLPNVKIPSTVVFCKSNAGYFRHKPRTGFIVVDLRWLFILLAKPTLSISVEKHLLRFAKGFSWACRHWPAGIKVYRCASFVRQKNYSVKLKIKPWDYKYSQSLLWQPVDRIFLMKIYRPDFAVLHALIPVKNVHQTKGNVLGVDQTSKTLPWSPLASACHCDLSLLLARQQWPPAVFKRFSL